MSDSIGIMLFAAAFDLLFAEPPASVHLTVWIGRTIGVAEKTGLAIKGRAAQFIFGLVASIVLTTAFFLAAYHFLAFVSGWNAVVYVVVAAALLKTTFCVRESWQLSLGIKKYLEAGGGDLSRAEPRVRFLLTTVERSDGEPPDDRPIVSSTIRSLMENASDFLVAPLFFYLFLGVPGAIAYRVANTLDGMLGHRGEYEYLGKFAAHFDDALNFIPARLAGLMIVAAACFSGLNAGAAWRMMLRDHGKTESPNGGWPMAAAAGALEVRLDRAGHYALGDAVRPLTAGTIGQGVKLFRFMAGVDLAFTVSALVLIYYLR